MNSLSASQIIQIWEQGRDQHPVDRALTILVPAYPEMTRDALADLSIGTRDAFLLAVREQTFGDTLNGAADCPQCSDSLEFSIGIETIRTEPKSVTERPSTLMLDDHVVEFRLLTSHDLAAAAQCEDVAASRFILLERCVERIVCNDSKVSVTDMPDRLITELVKKLDEYDPQANVMLELQCPECAGSWQMPLDIVSFLWNEIAALAKRLLYEVHKLASTYGWSEQAILSLSPVRRQNYLEMVS
jgi:hypothetical protein